MSNFNWELGVADAGVFWETIKTYKGWKFQNNTVFGQYRVISPDKIRKAWGFNKEEILDDFKQFSGYESEEKKTAPTSTSSSTAKASDSRTKWQLRKELDEELIRIGHLLETGILTDTEFQERKAIILKELKSLK